MWLQVAALVLILACLAVMVFVGILHEQPNLIKDYPSTEPFMRGQNRWITVGVAGGVTVLLIVMLVMSARRSPYRFQDDYVDYGAPDQCLLHPHLPRCRR